MDLSEMVTPKSDQQNYDDYIAGPRTVTISGVSGGSKEQPLNIELEEYPGRPFKPNLSMRRVLLKAWGKDPKTFVGRRLTLIGNPAVTYGGKAVGGIEIAAMSHIDKSLTMALTATRGNRKNFTVQPLKEQAPAVAAATAVDWSAEISKTGTDTAALRALWTRASNDGATQEVLDMIRNHAAAHDAVR